MAVGGRPLRGSQIKDSIFLCFESLTPENEPKLIISCMYFPSEIIFLRVRMIYVLGFSAEEFSGRENCEEYTNKQWGKIALLNFRAQTQFPIWV